MNKHPQDGFSRRQFLLMAGSVTALGLGGGIWFSSRVPAYEQKPLQALDAEGRAVIQRLIRLWFDIKEAGLPSAEAVQLEQQFDHLLSGLHQQAVADVLLGLSGLNRAAVVYGAYGKPLTQLDDQQAAEYLQRWATGMAPQKALFGALRQLLLLGYWRHEDSWAYVNYQGPVYLRQAHPALGNAPLPS